MIHTPIEGSSNVASIAHEGNVMQVTFKHGGTYEYPGVTEDQHALLVASDSIGKALNGLGVKGIKLQEGTP